MLIKKKEILMKHQSAALKIWNYWKTRNLGTFSMIKDSVLLITSNSSDRHENNILRYLTRTGKDLRKLNLTTNNSTIYQEIQSLKV